MISHQFALAGDITLKEMNTLELNMLWSIKFSLNVSRQAYDECVDVLIDLDNNVRPTR